MPSDLQRAFQTLGTMDGGWHRLCRRSSNCAKLYSRWFEIVKRAKLALTAPCKSSTVCSAGPKMKSTASDFYVLISMESSTATIEIGWKVQLSTTTPWNGTVQTSRRYRYVAMVVRELQRMREWAAIQTASLLTSKRKGYCTTC
jgi:hypothetical protein